MWEKLRDWVRRWLGIKLPEEPSPDGFVQRYEDIKAENITATIANKLAMLTFADSTMEIADRQSEEPGQRVAMIAETLQRMWEQDIVGITAQAFGKGGKVLIPVVRNGHIEINTIDQNRMVIREMDGHRLKAVTMLVDATTYNDRRYYLMADYELAEDAQLTRYRVVDDNGASAELTAIPKWQEIELEMTVSGVDRLLFAYLRCPRDNRRDVKRFGVPITYGAEQDVAELVEHIRIYQREFKLTRPMLGLDASLWRSPDGKATDINAVRKTVQDSDEPFIPFDSRSLDGSGIWQHFAPSIRYEAMEARYNGLCRRIEKVCGLSQGILTERQSLNYANKDEVRAAQYDTFATLKAMRITWEHALDDLAYSIDVLAERFGLTPAGARDQWEISIDWDTGLIESTTEAFNQMRELHEAKLVSGPELRQWVMGGTLEEAQEAIDEIRQNEPNGGVLENLLGGLGTGGDE